MPLKGPPDDSLPPDQGYNPSFPPTVNDPGLPSNLPPVPGDILPEQLDSDYYDGYDLHGLYLGDMGLLQVPVAGSPDEPQCEIVRMHNPTGVRVLEWDVERVGSPPNLPAFDTQNPNEVPARYRVYPHVPRDGPDGTKIYRTSGRYEYMLLQPPQLGQDVLATGAAPYSATPAAANDIDPGTFDPTLTDSSSAVPGGFVPPTD